MRFNVSIAISMFHEDVETKELEISDYGGEWINFSLETEKLTMGEIVKFKNKTEKKAIKEWENEGIKIFGLAYTKIWVACLEEDYGIVFTGEQIHNDYWEIKDYLTKDLKDFREKYRHEDYDYDFELGCYKEQYEKELSVNEDGQIVWLPKFKGENVS